jgi:hypothetical protein
VEVVARDRLGLEDRSSRSISVQAPDPKPRVEAWVRDYCRQIEERYKQGGEPSASVSCRDVVISGALPRVQVSFVRVDRLSGGEKSIDKSVRLECSPACREL